MTFDEINIRHGDPRYTNGRAKIDGLVATTQKEETIATAVLMGAEFHQVGGLGEHGNAWFIAKYEGKNLAFTERFSLHRCAIAFLICVKFFYGDGE